MNFEHVDYDPFELGEVAVAFRATAPQREIWLGASIGGEDANRAYNECLVLRINGALDRLALQGAYQSLVHRHQALRATFSADGEWCLIGQSVAASCPQLDLRGAPELTQRAKLEELRLHEVTTCFDLTRGPLCRATLVVLSETRHLLLFSAHHIVCDWWSAGVLMEDLGALYRERLGTAPSLRPAASFADYARLQVERLDTESGQRDLQYWLDAMVNYTPSWELPSERARPRRRVYASRRVDVEWSPAVNRAVRELAARHRCTVTTTCLTLLQAWLFAKVGANDVVIGVPSSGQVAHGEYRLVGHCVHLLPVRLRCDGADSFAETILAAKRAILRGLEHQQLTYSTLLSHLPQVRKPGQLPLVPVCLNVDKGLPELDFGELDVSYETIPRRFESFELSLNVVVSAARLVIQCNYNVGLFVESTIRNWVNEIGEIAEYVSRNPRLLMGDLAAAIRG